MIDEPSPQTIRAQQKARRNGALGVLGTVSTLALSAILQLLQITRADAEKSEITSSYAALQAEIIAMRQDFRQLSERITRVETQLAERTTQGHR